MMGRFFAVWLGVAVVTTCAQWTTAVESPDEGHMTEHAQKKTIELQTAYVYRKANQQTPHYSVILGSSGKTVLGPAISSPGKDEIHRVQGFVLNNDEVQLGDTSSFAKAAVIAHNRYRMLHHAPPLTWSENLARQARRLAYKMAKEKIEMDKRTMIIKSSSFRTISTGTSEKSSDQGSKRNSVVKGNIPDEEMDLLGENIERLFSVGYGCDGQAALEVVNKWYNEHNQYSYAYPHVDEKTSSFTQLVWKGSKTFGAGCALRRGLLTNDVFVVALYSPPGNSGGGVSINVLRPGRQTHKDDVYSNIFK